MKHPFISWKVQRITELAFRETSRRFPGIVSHNNQADAFRHCYWTALLTKDIGFEKAKEFTELHEKRSGNPLAEKDMDLHDNRVGLELGSLGRPENWLSHECNEALKRGRLKVIFWAKERKF